MSKEYPTEFVPETQPNLPGKEFKMQNQPLFKAEWYKGSGKLQGKRALITGGDSGIGRAVAILFAREGADVAIGYLSSEERDAQETKTHVEGEGARCVLLPGDICDRQWCSQIVQRTVSELGGLDILVNNAARQMTYNNLEELPDEEIEKTFRTNIISMFYITKAALPHMAEGSSIINTTSVTSFQGNPKLIDYSSTKGAITTFTRSLAMNLASRKIRVNGVAPGPIMTPLIPASFSADKVAEFGKTTAMGRAGQPEEVAPSFVFLASQDSSYFTGQILHPNGGKVVNA